MLCLLLTLYSGTDVMITRSPPHRTVQHYASHSQCTLYRTGSRHQEPPHTDVSRNLATVVVRGVLPGQRRRRTGLLPSGPKSSFQMRASFVFHLETKVLESGGRAEKLIAQVA